MLTMSILDLISRVEYHTETDPIVDLEVESINYPHQATSDRSFNPPTLVPGPSKDRNMAVKYKDNIFF